ncbi:hypothetical protein JTF06_14350 [Desemzia sp. RIT804]|uniref:hypothetical protein n=1 Tax=Desemzia sp. RIT 804 TaxID=2810209 RepID=UPI0019517C06|nr:hypothetical protein [Desemzia sp. RIT 804]MBM6616061.1 hypothetical protein [Desemzia sp. RIT 804]
MKLFFLKLFWQLLPVAIVCILVFALYGAWFLFLKDFWQSGALKRLLAVSFSAIVVCSCMIVLLGFSTQSRLPFGQKIASISADQAVVKEQKELVKELDSAIDVANDQKYIAEDLAVETITPDWIATYQDKINDLSDPEVRERYKKRFTTIENYFYPG